METKNRLLSVVAAGLVTFLAFPAHADDQRRFYAIADIGAGTLGSQTIQFDDGNGVSSSKLDFDASFAGGGTLGYRISDRWAIEGGITYRRNEFDTINLAALGTVTEGDFASLSYDLSALYRFNIGQSGKLSGYIGPGLVYVQEIDIDFEDDAGNETEFDGDDTALQVKFGGRYDFSDRWFVDASARWLTTDGVRMRGTNDASQTITSDYDHWSFSVGAGFQF